MTEPKKIKIEFAPGCFDGFEGTQEELDEFMAELEQKISSMTPEELKAESRPIDDEYLEDLIKEDPEYALKLLNILQDNDRKLQ
jgi:hypothetical protein